MVRVRLASDPQRRKLMQHIRRRGTPLEAAIAAICRELGLRYRRNVKSLPGSPDLANKSARWAIFANGCFWHHHEGCKLGTTPKRNARFWTDKFAQNRARDARKTAELRAQGFRVLVVWQCEMANRGRLCRRISCLCEPRVVKTS